VEVVPENHLKKSCPNLYQYLRDRKNELEERTYLKDGNKDWYEIWCPRDIGQQEQEKIVVPELADRSQFAFVERGVFYVDTTCGITLSRNCPFDLWYLLGVLNSKPAEYLYRKTTVPKANGFLIYKTMFLSTLRIPIPNSDENRASASRVSELARKVQEYGTAIATLEKAFDASLQASLPLMDETQQSFKADYYEVASYWKVRNLLPSGGLTLSEPVIGIKVENDVLNSDGSVTATPRLNISYKSEKQGHWKVLISLEPITDDLREFVVLAARRHLKTNDRKRSWKLRGRNASNRTVDVVLGSLLLPIWGLLHRPDNQGETNLRKISDIMRALRAEIGSEINPSVLDAQRKSLENEIDGIVLDLYGMNDEERLLLTTS
jgi:hypothetical protein